MALGSAVALFVVLTTLALPGMAQRQQERAARITPVFDYTTSPAPDAAAARGFGSPDSWDRRELRRVVVAVTGPEAPVPPGVSRLPRPGEVVLSPALERLIRREPLVAQRFPQRVIGNIDREGLVEPGQLLAYVGVGRNELVPNNDHELVGFGGEPSPAAAIEPRTARVVGLLLLLTLVAPVLMLMVTCARLSATTRNQRLAALRLLGVDRRRAQRVNAVETGLVGLAGGGVGLLVWAGWRHFVPEVRVGSFTWYADDLRLAGWQMVAAVAGLALLAVVVGALGSRASVRDPLPARREGSARTVSAWRVIPLAAGLLLLAVSWVTARDGSAGVAEPGDMERWLLPFGAGLSLSAVGLVLVVPFLTTAIGGVLHRLERPAALLAGGRLRHEPAVAARMLAALTMSVFAVGAAQVVLVAVQGGAHAWWTETVLPPGANANLQAHVPPETTAEDLRAVSDVGVAYEGDEALRAVIASCHDLRLAAARDLPDCREGEVYRVEPPADSSIYPDLPPEPAGDSAAVDQLLSSAGLPPAAGTLELELLGPSAAYNPAVLVPPSLASPDMFDTSCCFVTFSGEGYDPQRAMAALAERFPGASWNALITGVDRYDTPRLYSGVVAVGTVAALIIGLFALCVASVDRAIERRGNLAHLAALGTPPRTIRVALVLQMLPVSALTLSAAAVTAILGSASYLRWDDPSIEIPLGVLARLVVAALLAAATATCLALVGTVARPRPNLLRRE